MAAVVTAPLVLVKDPQGATQYVYQGAPVPEYVDGDVLARLVADGLVSEEDAGSEDGGDAKPRARRSSSK